MEYLASDNGRGDTAGAFAAASSRGLVVDPGPGLGVAGGGEPGQNRDQDAGSETHGASGGNSTIRAI